MPVIPVISVTTRQDSVSIVNINVFPSALLQKAWVLKLFIVTEGLEMILRHRSALTEEADSDVN